MLSSESSASSSASSKCKAIKLSLLPNQKVFLYYTFLLFVGTLFVSETTSKTMSFFIISAIY